MLKGIYSPPALIDRSVLCEARTKTLLHVPVHGGGGSSKEVQSVEGRAYERTKKRKNSKEVQSASLGDRQRWQSTHIRNVPTSAQGGKKDEKVTRTLSPPPRPLPPSKYPLPTSPSTHPPTHQPTALRCLAAIKAPQLFTAGKGESTRLTPTNVP